MEGPAQDAHQPLSKQESRVLELAMAGKNDPEVAEELGIQVDTVRTYWDRIRQKLGLTSRSEIIAQMVREGAMQELHEKEVENERLHEEIARRRVLEHELEISLQKLEQERSRLAAVLEQMPSGVVIAEAPSGRIIATNRRVKEILHPVDIEADDVHDYKKFGFIREDGSVFLPEELPLARSLQRGETVSNERVILVFDTGRRCDLDVSTAPIRDRSGRVVAGVAVVHDVTAQTAMQASHDAAEARYRRLFHNALDGVFICDSEGRYVDINPAGAGILGYDRDQLIGRSCLEVSPPNAQVLAKSVNAELQSKGSWEGVYPLVHSDGHVIELHWRSVVADDGLILGIARPMSASG